MSELREFAGKLNERVYFEQRTDRQGLWGALEDEWRPVVECWASVERERGRGSANSGDTRHSARVFRVVMRAGPRLDLGMRMKWRGLEMLVVDVDDFSRDHLCVLVEEMR